MHFDLVLEQVRNLSNSMPKISGISAGGMNTVTAGLDHSVINTGGPDHSVINTAGPKYSVINTIKQKPAVEIHRAGHRL